MALASAGVVVAADAQPAAAATGNMLPPFDLGQTWNICQGYNGPVSHTGTSLYGLDLTGAGCDNSAAGRNVRAPISGTVSYYQASYGNLCVNIAGNESYTLTHIDSSITGGSVTAGQLVGTVAAAGTRGNNNLAHIHFQIWASPNCYNSSVIPFDSAHAARICGAPDLTASGPNGGNGIWSGTSFTGTDCSTSSPNDFDSDGITDSNDSCPYVAGTAPNRGCPNSVTQVSGDLNGDGKADIIAISRNADNSPSLSWFQSTSTGTSTSLADPVSLGVNLPAPAWNVDGLKWASGDFNGDGRTDLFAASGSGTGPIGMYIFLSTGTGLAAPVEVKDPPYPGWQWSRLQYFAGDFDGDGKADIYAISRGPNNEPDISWLRSTSSGMTPSLADPAFLKSEPAPWWNVDNLKWVVGDFDGNGKADLFAASGDTNTGPGMYIFASDGASLADPVNVKSPNPAYWLWDRLTFMRGDLDGDHKDDIIYVSRAPDDSPGMGWFQSTSATMSPSLADGVGFNLAMSAPAWNVSNLKWAVGDYNGDGKTDVMTASGDNGNGIGMYILPAGGTGTSSVLNNPVNVKSPNPAYWYWWRIQF